ncbi:MAG: hydrogenase maturation protease [Phycisphaerae bacterium]|nr:hydrogenase maturation protease [Phycisphaerae bacterium]
MKRIVCVGNRYRPEDASGVLVYDRLASTTLPPDVEVIDGGLSGLDLLRFVDGTDRVVFVDAVSGFGPPGSIVVLTREEAMGRTPVVYSHDAGLAYLLGVLQSTVDGPLPEIRVIGIEGAADGRVIRAAADLCIEMAVAGDAGEHGRADQAAGASS